MQSKWSKKRVAIETGGKLVRRAYNLHDTVYFRPIAIIAIYIFYFFFGWFKLLDLKHEVKKITFRTEFSRAHIQFSSVQCICRCMLHVCSKPNR